MLFLLNNIFIVLVIGLIFALLMSAFFALLIKILCSFRTLFLLKSIAILLMFFFYFIQFSLFFAMREAEPFVENAETIITHSISAIEGDMNNILSREEGYQLKMQIKNEYPILTPFIDDIDVEEMVGNKKRVLEAVVSSVKSEIRWFKWKRIMWIVIATIVSIIGITLFDESPSLRSSSSRRSRSHRRDLSRPSRRHVRR